MWKFGEMKAAHTLVHDEKFHIYVLRKRFDVIIIMTSFNISVSREAVLVFITDSCWSIFNVY